MAPFEIKIILVAPPMPINDLPVATNGVHVAAHGDGYTRGGPGSEETPCYLQVRDVSVLGVLEQGQSLVTTVSNSTKNHVEILYVFRWEYP